MTKKRILIVDDEVDSARLLKANLEQTNHYEVRTEKWPEDVVDRVREFRPHLILLDIIMPRMAGGDVAAAIKEDPDLKDTAIVWLTAAVWRHQVEENDGIICDYPCLAKPASLEEIMNCIEANLAC